MRKDNYQSTMCKEFKKSDKYKEMIVEGPFICVWQECKEPFYTKRKAWTALGKPTKPRPIQSRQAACSVQCQSNHQNLKLKRRSPGIAQDGSARIHKDENGNYPTATCPYCQETFERRFGHRQRVCQNAECQRGWKNFQGIWNNLYGSIKNWPYIPKDVRRTEFTHNCIGCKKDFTFTTYVDAEGNPIFMGGKGRKYCKEECFDKHYHQELLTKEQREKYQAKSLISSRKERDNLGDSYVKAVLQAQFNYKDDGFSISSKEISQEMIEDKRNLLKLKRAYKKATGCTMQSLSYSSTMGSRWH
jgi:hypothetical protein